jgi:F-type H+-transporting ATPase subunit b
MYHDPKFWVAVSFTIFVILLFKPVQRLLLKGLDSRTSRIRKELDEAHTLREEAQALLSSYQRKQLDAEEEAKRIIRDAENEAASIAKKAEKDLEEALNRRIELAMQKLNSYESAILFEIRNNAIDIATNTVRRIVEENLSKDASHELVTQSIDHIQKKMN